MARHTEYLDGGLNNAEDPAFLTTGQLSFLRNGIYLGGSRALQRAKGRVIFATATSSALDVVGLRDIQFDNGDQKLVALVSASLLTAAITGTTATGTFGSLATLVATASSLERVQYRNRYFLLNGVSVASTAASANSNVVAYLSATGAGTVASTRVHGLLPVLAAPHYTTAAGTFSQSVTGYYEYWTTEVAKFTQDGAELAVESAFESTNGVTTVFVSATGVVPTIQMPQTRNGSTTHWRVYRSPKKDKEGDKKFPSGFLVSTDLSTATASFPDTSTTASASSFPGSENASAFFFGFATASAMRLDDGNYASATTPAFIGAVQQLVYGFNLGGFSGSVRGIAVEVQGYVSSGAAPVPVEVTIGRRNSNTGGFQGSLVEVIQGTAKVASKSGNITSTNPAAPTTFTLGGATDRWFATDKVGFSDTDFGTDFAVRLSVSAPSRSVGFDYVKVYVYYAASIDSTVPYPSVVYTFGDISAQVSKNHPPPSANTGDLYEDTLVLNDVDNPALIRWSFPGEPEYFPPTYYLDFETNENDRVRLVKVVNTTLVVALDSSTWRINYLPSERDSSFDRGKAIQPISKTYGCVNPMCAATFSPDGGPELLAFVSDHGIHVTDGHSFDTLTDGIDWRTLVLTTDTASRAICLINDRELQELLFYYRTGTSGDEVYQCLHLSYAADHMVNGKPKISGPVVMTNYDSTGPTYASLESAWALQRSNGVTEVFLGYGTQVPASAGVAAGAGRVFRESGTTLPTPPNADTLRFSTRRMYLADLGNEWKVGDLYGYTGSYTGSPVVTYTAQNTKTNDDAAFTVLTKSITLGGQKLHKVSPQATVEGLQITATAVASSYAQTCLVIDGEDFGEEDAGT